MNHHPFSFHLTVAFRSVLFVVATVVCVIVVPSLAEAQIADPPAELQVSALPESAGGTLTGAEGDVPPVTLTGGTGESDASAESLAISATCYVWANLYKRKWLFRKVWVHRLGAPCTDRHGCLHNAEYKYDHSVRASGPAHSWEEGGKAQDFHSPCG